MKWTSKIWSSGDTRTRTIFLLFPKSVYNSEKGVLEWRWLERVTFVEKYRISMLSGGWWSEIAWVDD